MNYKGMDSLVADIRRTIEEKIDQGYKKFIIFPFGDVGMRVKEILNICYGIQEEYIVDNRLYKYNFNIIKMSDIKEVVVNLHKYSLLLSSTNSEIYKELKEVALEYFDEKQIAELFCMRKIPKKERIPQYTTVIGKYSYGPICRNHKLIESIGAFSSFAEGVDVVAEHEINFLTIHPMISASQYIEGEKNNYTDYSHTSWYFPGVNPKNIVTKRKRCKIGNDVWLGKNVTVTKCANIGNGVIAGAGAVITKDVPDYAIVMGVPARIVRYRYTKEEIKALNKIKWWDWPDEKIKENFNDFYLPISKFIQKWQAN